MTSSERDYLIRKMQALAKDNGQPDIPDDFLDPLVDDNPSETLEEWADRMGCTERFGDRRDK